MGEQPIPDAVSDKALADYAEAIGFLTIYWAALENALSLVIENLLGVDELTGLCVSTSVDKAASRAMLIQRLALRPGEAPSDRWKECLTGICDQIANKLGPARNRLIHDEWFIVEEAITRQNNALRIGHPASHEPKALLKQSAAPSHVPDISAMTMTVTKVMIYLVFLAVGYRRWKQTGRVPEVPEQAMRVSKGLPPVPPSQDGEA